MHPRSFLSMALVALALPCFAQLEDPKPKQLIGARNMSLSPDGKRLAFVYRGDIWVSSSAGGKADPVATNLEMDDYPVWSPDGKWIAFASGRTGNWDIFAVPADGGETKRLTWHSGTDVPRGWTPDGKYIVFSATRDDPHNGIYLLDVRTTQLREVMRDMMTVTLPEYSPDGSEILYRRFQFDWTRPRYEGSGAAQLWRYDIASGKRIKVRDTDQQHLWPHFGPDSKTIYAVTVTEKTPSSSYLDKPIPRVVDNVNRTPNVYAIDGGGRARRLTGFVGGSGARFLTVARKTGELAFEREGDVYIMEPGGEPKKISLTASIDEKTSNEERLVLTTGAESASLSHKNDKIVFTVRRELWMVPTKKGKGPNADDATQLTAYAGSDGDPLWLPDGKSAFFISDRDGARRIYKLDTETKKVTRFTEPDYDHSTLQLTPDRKSLSYWMAGPAGGLFVVPIDGGTPKKVVDANHGSNYAWSPDGRYVAYARLLVGGGFNYWDSQWNVWITDTTTGKSENVTKLNAHHAEPEWSKDGRFLYFTSNRSGGGLYVLPLTQEDARETELELKFEKPAGPVKVVIDFTDTETRIRRLNTQQPTHNITSDPTNGDIYFMSEGDIFKVSYSGEDAKRMTTGGGIGGFDMSEDHNSLMFIKGGGLNTMNLRAPGTPVAAVAFRADWMRNIRAEHEAAFREFWRAYNRGFYDPNFHGRDWTEIRGRYEPLMDAVWHRNEMATLLNMMVGELETSHAEAGPASGGPNGESSPHVGFFIDYSHQGPGLRIKEVPARAPGSYTKTKLNAGEYVMAINGQDVRPDEGLWRVLNEQANREVTLLVNTTPTKAGAREVKYRALSNGAMGQIVYRNRIDARRRYVEQKSGGKLTYIHIAGMGGGNFETFNREAWAYAQGKEGVIIDVRNNGGGNISDMLLDILERKPQARYKPRDGEVYTAPGTAWDMPTVVMHAETSFSNAEMFPAAMKDRALAQLVGMPTPGYVVYTNGFQLVDGTSARMPGTGVYRLNGAPLEDNGVQPDFKIEILPEEYFAGKDPQLDKAIEILMKQVK